MAEPPSKHAVRIARRTVRYSSASAADRVLSEIEAERNESEVDVRVLYSTNR
jgi:hypothetical protein